MIIIHPQETGSLPNSTALQPVQYAGQGQGLEKTGGQIAGVSNAALQYTSHLNAQLAKVQSVQGGKRAHSILSDEADAYWQQWDNNFVQKGALPEESINNFETWFEKNRENLDNTYAEKYQNNSFLKERVEAAYEDVRADVLTKARQYARTKYLEIGRTNLDSQLETDKIAALKADASGDPEEYSRIANGSLVHIDSLKGTIINDAEALKKKQSFVEDLETQKAFQMVARSPEQFLEAYHSGSGYGRVNPKTARELVVAAEGSLARQVDRRDHAEKEQKAATDQRRQDFRNDLIAQATTPVGASAALAYASTPANRHLLGPDFDNTVATLRAMSNPANTPEDATTISSLKREIESAPSQAVYKKLDYALQNGKIKTDTFTSFTTRNTERIEKIRDKVESDRLKRTNLAVSTYQPLLKVTGINDFDKTSNAAQQLYEDEVRAKVEADPKSDPMTVGKQILPKYLDYIADTAEGFAEAIANTHGYKSDKEVLDAYERKDITRADADVQLWYFNRQKNKKPSSAPSGSALIKAK